MPLQSSETHIKHVRNLKRWQVSLAVCREANRRKQMAKDKRGLEVRNGGRSGVIRTGSQCDSSSGQSDKR